MRVDVTGRWAHRILLWLLGGTVLGSLEAQELPLIPGTPPSRCQFDTAAFRDTSDYMLFLTPPLSLAGASKRRDSYTPYLSAIASTFEQPRRLSFTYWPGTRADTEEPTAVPRCIGDERGCTAGILDGEVQFRLKEGRVQVLQWVVPPDSPEAVQALEQAIHRADTLQLFPSSAKIKGLPPGIVRMGIRLSRDLPSPGSVAVSRIRLPFIRATTPVAILHQESPPHPAALPDANVIVSLRYIVTEDGYVQHESIRVGDEARQAHPVFVRAAMRAISLSQFRPARAGSCPIRLMVDQRVVFRSR